MLAADRQGPALSDAQRVLANWGRVRDEAIIADIERRRIAS
jgi:hypothetical protein